MAQDKKEQRFRRLKAFGTAFSLTLCLLALGTGFLVADYNTRRMTFGAAAARGSIPVPDPGQTPLTKEQEAIAGRLWTVLPARWRTAAWITEAERAWAPDLIEFVNRELDKVKRLYSSTDRIYDRVLVSGAPDDRDI